MQTHFNPFNRFVTTGLVACVIALLICSCASKGPGTGSSVSLTQLSAPARATVDRVTAGGVVEKIDKERERGQAVYDVEATVGGKHVEYLVAESTGAVLGTETEIEFSELPQPVRDAATGFFGTATGLKAMKGVEFGETQYEIEGKKNGRTVELTFDPSGKRQK